MKSSDQHRVAALSKLRRAIQDLNGSGRPDELKALAVQAVQAGNSRKQVASAVGVTGRTITNWRVRKLKLPQVRKAVRLAIVSDRAVPTAEVPQARRSDGVAKIVFKTGIVVEVPTSCLTALLITGLNGGGQ